MYRKDGFYDWIYVEAASNKGPERLLKDSNDSNETDKAEDN